MRTAALTTPFVAAWLGTLVLAFVLLWAVPRTVGITVYLRSRTHFIPANVFLFWTVLIMLSIWMLWRFLTFLRN